LSAIYAYLKSEEVTEKEDEVQASQPGRDSEWGLQSVMSQASRASFLEAAEDGKTSSRPAQVIGWNGTADSEVCICLLRD
jgi:hypothetical protein